MGIDVVKKAISSFTHAVSGIIWAVRNHNNFKIHIVLSIVVVLMAYFFEVSPIEWTILLLAISFGLGVEMVNTAIEEMTNLITVKWSKNAKIAKDVSAGMVLLVALATLIVGLVIFIPKL